MNSTPEAIERDAGKLGTLLIQTLDKAMSWQSSAITGYVKRLHEKKPNQSPAEVQARIDAHFLNIVTGTGGTAGAAAVIPGVGVFTGLAAVAGESLLFLELPRGTRSPRRRCAISILTTPHAVERLSWLL
nr:hypothetical protein [Corynebacterium lactis]